MPYGQRKNYFWAEWPDRFLRDLVAAVPKIVLDHYLVNATFDSGPLLLSEDEKKAGWHSTGALAFSPKILDVASIPSDQFDEWLIFLQPAAVATWIPFINYLDFSLADPHGAYKDEFWRFLEELQPESYLAEGTNLIFVTRDRFLQELALGAIA
jgi:hypothetical protein